MSKLKRKEYERELEKLQTELVRMQTWIKETGARIIVVFEGRDAAGKGGVINRITRRVSPRIFRVAALPTPSDREISQFYLQRYMNHFPAAGEVVLFDRSWYNRAGIEHVMGFCSEDQYERFMQSVADFERMVVDSGIMLIKYWLTVSQEVQKERFQQRIEDPMRQWKLSPTDLQSVRLWYEYSRARDAMFVSSDTQFAPWYIVDSNDKRRARLNCISHFLSLIPYETADAPGVAIPEVKDDNAYDDQEVLRNRQFVPEVY